MTVRDFFELLESAGYLVDVDVYTGYDCEGAEEMQASELMSSKYADRRLLGFDVGRISITVDEGTQYADEALKKTDISDSIAKITVDIAAYADIVKWDDEGLYERLEEFARRLFKVLEDCASDNNTLLTEVETILFKILG